MILSYADRETERLAAGEPVRRIPNEVRDRARLRLTQLNAAAELEFMRLPPSNRLEALKGDRKGQHSVRISLRWRLCFRWSAGNAHDVENVDYHE